MGWASHAIADLRAGRVVRIRPRGHSMRPRIRSGALCTIAPVAARESLSAGDIVLCSVRGRQYLHLVRVVRDNRYQIANNRGHINGWVGRRAIHGRLIAIGP